MELKADYKRTELGVVPIDWEILPIKELCQIKTGGKDTQDKVDNGKFPFYVRSNRVERINTWCYDGEAVLTAGDGVGTGKVFHYATGKFNVHQRVYQIFNFHPAKLDGYFFYLYFSKNFYSRVSQMTAKSSVDSVRMEMIADMKILLPSTKEQRGISKHLKNVNSLILELEELITKKKSIKQGLLQELLTGKRRLPEFCKKWDGKYKNTDVGVIPSDWDVISYGDSFQFLATSSYSRAEVETYGDIKYIHYGDIHTKYDEYLDIDSTETPYVRHDQKKNYAYIQHGDVIMADASEDYAGICKSTEIFANKSFKAISGLHTLLLRDKTGRFENGFKGLIHLNPLVIKSYKSMATGLKVYGVTKGNLKKIIIPYPPLKEEQLAIVNYNQNIKLEIESLEQKLSKYKKIKDGMMQKLLTGEIRLV